MEKIDQAVATYGDLLQTSLLVIMEETLIAVGVFVLWLWLLMQILKPFRTCKNGNPLDNSMFTIFFASVLGLIGAFMTIAIYLDMKVAVFGTINFSYLKAIF